MRLKHLLHCLPEARTTGPLDADFSGVTSEARLIKPGMVYVAMTAGEDYGLVHDALERGACAIISERNPCTRATVAQIRVPDVRLAIAEAARLYHREPSSKLLMIGVAGVAQRTGIAHVAHQLLNRSGLRSGLIGRSGVLYADREWPDRATVTPEAADTQDLLAQMVKGGCKACVLEITPEAVADDRLSGIGFDLLLFTPDFDEENQQWIVQKLRAQLKGKRSQALFLNRHNEVKENGRTFAIATNAVFGKESSSFEIRSLNSGVDCLAPLPGRQSVAWILGAYSLCFMAGVCAPTLIRALKDLRPVPGQMEKIEAEGLALQPCTVFLERARTDLELIIALNTVREITKGRLFLVLGAEGNRPVADRVAFGRTAALLSDFAIFTRDNPRREDPLAIAEEMAGGFKAVRTHGYRIETDRDRAIQDAVKMARVNDVVLVAGKGADRWDEVDDSVAPYDDAEVVRDALSSQRLFARELQH
jgi:UDP-N-acetylmuramoyl-L-alanyl-D-glutamate--2,6-diaminopimelate ligase